MAKKHVMVIMSNAVKGREDEYNAWYTNQHVPDVLKVTGMVAAQRYKLGPVQRQGVAPAKWQYMAVYEIETDTPEATFADLARRARGPQMPLSDAITDTWGYVFEPITERVLAPK